MDKSKIKSFIILLLAIVNIFLLTIVITNARDESIARDYRNAALRNVLNTNGITMSEDTVLPEKMLSSISLSRDLENERQLVSKLIGNCEIIDKGGNIIFYKGVDGQAIFRGTGAFEILLESDIMLMGSNPINTCEAALKKLGIKYSSKPVEIFSSSGNTSVIMQCAWKGTQIYNAEIRFDFSGNRLLLIYGTRPLDVETTVQTSDTYQDAATILMNFLQHIRDTGEVCSEIKSVDLGYFSSAVVSGSSSLKPMWCIQTDSGKYFLDGRTGKPEKLE